MCDVTAVTHGVMTVTPPYRGSQHTSHVTPDDDAPVAVRVRCTNPQALLETGNPCGWLGERTGYVFERRDGTTARTDPARKRCPRCGAAVQAIPRKDDRP